MSTQREYNSRLVDEMLKKRLEMVGAVVIRGVKGCGKTFTAEQLARSKVFVDTDMGVRSIIDADPALLLRGEVPRLLDEWQIYPELWNYVRREVDRRQSSGQFLLTGSANPAADAKIHSGVGRFSVLQMRPMSRVERGWSTGEVRLTDLLDADASFDFSDIAGNVYSIDEVVLQLAIGGWPKLLDASDAKALQFSRDYISLTAEADIHRVDGVRRDPARVTRLIQSFARNLATQATVTSMTKDARGDDVSFSDVTAHAYLNALEQLMIIDNLPAWNTHVRSTARLRSTPKRHFADPSLAVGSLKLSLNNLLQDLEYTGFLFESSVIRDLRVYADVNDAEVSFFRDAKDREVDAIVHKSNGDWAGFEIKLGDARIDEGANALHKLLEVLDSSKVKKPSSLNVITSSGFPYRRKDGVNVIPVSVLTA